MHYGTSAATLPAGAVKRSTAGRSCAMAETIVADGSAGKI